ncbi:MAG: lysozyme inhibitor LprI family protein [Sulfitobacter sp.]
MCCALLLAPLLGGGAQAQTDEACLSPQTQLLMTECAFKAYDASDVELNEVWISAKEFADAIGQGDALLEAQRTWLAFRDAACGVHAAPYEGGSIQPMIRANCLSTLTQERTRMLREFHAY